MNYWRSQNCHKSNLRCFTKGVDGTLTNSVWPPVIETFNHLEAVCTSSTNWFPWKPVSEWQDTCCPPEKPLVLLHKVRAAYPHTQGYTACRMYVIASVINGNIYKIRIFSSITMRYINFIDPQLLIIIKDTSLCSLELWETIICIQL